MHKSLRIIQVINVRWYNATAWYGLSLGELLERSGHEVRVLALPGTEPWKKAEALIPNLPLGLYSNSINPYSTIRNFKLLQDLIRDFKPHLVNCHRGEGMFLFGLLKAMGDRFALVRTRGDQRPPKANFVNRYLYSRVADAVIATNSRTKRQCATLLGVAPSRLHLIPGGVNRDFFLYDPFGRARIRDKYGFGEKDIVVGVVGRFDPVKGHRELLQAVAIVRGRLKQGSAQGRLRLMLMGFPANISLSDMEHMVRQTGLDDCCVITGKVSDVPSHISAMDLGVVSSVGSEAIARAAFEIMSCGVPLVSTDVGVMPDLLQPEALVPAGDIESLAALLQSAIEVPAFREKLAADQAERMPSFSQTAFLEQTLSAYREAIKLAQGHDQNKSQSGI